MLPVNACNSLYRHHDTQEKVFFFFLDNAVINSRRKKSILVGVEVSPEVQTSIITAKRLLQIHMPAYNSIP